METVVSHYDLRPAPGQRSRECIDCGDVVERRSIVVSLCCGLCLCSTCASIWDWLPVPECERCRETIYECVCGGGSR